MFISSLDYETHQAGCGLRRYKRTQGLTREAGEAPSTSDNTGGMSIGLDLVLFVQYLIPSLDQQSQEELEECCTGQGLCLARWYVEQNLLNNRLYLTFI